MSQSGESQQSPSQTSISWRLGKYELQAELGHGGMGVVYRAYDRVRNEVVAIKTLKALDGLDGEAIYRLRNEFRARADLVHPNLVNLYELFAEGDRLFFTMELVQGVDFLEYVRAGRSEGTRDRFHAAHPGPDVVGAAEGDPSGRMLRTHVPQTTLGQAPPPTSIRDEAAEGTACFAPAGLDSLARLRVALRQLAEGIEALHRAGLLHRDIKPSNVLVTREGRVVLLDFGLAVQRERAERAELSTPNVVGTIQYMSPEQACMARLTSASDWYSVGVMLFQALTGRMPLVGSAWELLQRKQEVDPPAPSDFSPGIPDDLNALCVELLRRDPALRPSGAEVLRRLLRAESVQSPPPVPPLPLVSRSPFVGRAAHLRALRDALAMVHRGRTAVVYVSGSSGVGKTALVQEFLSQIDGRGKSVLLQGKCHERESIPYKALDSIAESLAQYLLWLPSYEVQSLLPRDVVALARVFPIFRRVEAIAAARPREGQAPDQQELRQRAFAALRELLARLGDRKTLVLHVDDIQWGDLDSAALLYDLLRPPDPPLLLLLLSYRIEVRATSPALHALLNPQSAIGSGIETQQLVVEALTPEESRELARELFGGGFNSESLCEAIARESSGNPYFIEALVRRHQSAGQCGQAAPAISLDEVLWLRAEELPEPARRLLHVVAVAGHPLRQLDAFEAAGVGGERHEVLAMLRAARLLRTGGEGLEDKIDAYHDRVREAVVHRLAGATIVDCHRRLARTLENSGRTDAAELAAHFAAAGEDDQAIVHYRAAAAEADEALAFDYAAGLYQRAFAIRPPCGSEACELRTRLADALANSRRGAEAAEQYLMAAEGADAERALELTRRAATQLLVSGRIDRGIAVLRDVMSRMGMRLAKGPKRALCAIILRRLVLSFRGLSFSQRAATEVPQKDLAKIDTCWSASVGLMVVDPMYSADFQTRGLLLALRAGDSERIARFLALHAIQVAATGAAAEGHAKRIAAKAKAIAQDIGSAHATALAAAAEGVAALFAGRWKQAVESLDEAQQMLRERCTGVWWELDIVEGFALSSLFYSGQVAELTRRLPAALAAAQSRGDLLDMTRLGTLVLPWLAADDANEAQRQVEACMSGWPRDKYPIQQGNRLYAEVHIHLYRGSRAAAWRISELEVPALERSLIFHIQMFRGLMYDMRARCALAAAMEMPNTALLLYAAQRNARRLERENAPGMVPLAQRIRAGIAALRGEKDAAAEFLQRAVTGFEAADMPLHAAVSRRRLGELLNGQAGRSLIDEADAWMTGQGIKNPPRMTALYAPGFRDARGSS